jgi:hypothetical protein
MNYDYEYDYSASTKAKTMCLLPAFLHAMEANDANHFRYDWESHQACSYLCFLSRFEALFIEAFTILREKAALLCTLLSIRLVNNNLTDVQVTPIIFYSNIIYDVAMCDESVLSSPIIPCAPQKVQPKFDLLRSNLNFLRDFLYKCMRMNSLTLHNYFPPLTGWQ